jgi:hypothetical protein
MPILKNAKHEKFCQLVAKGSSFYAAYLQAGFSKNGARNNASRLIAKDIITKRVAELTQKVSQTLIAKSISVKENRVAVLQEISDKLRQVIAERAASKEMIGIPGGTTGLLAHDQKGVGYGPASTVIDVYEVDTPLLKELREYQKQAAIEMGQWVEKGDLTSGGEKLEAVKVTYVQPKKNS